MAARSLLPVLLAIALVASACSDSDGLAGEETSPQTSTPQISTPQTSDTPTTERAAVEQQDICIEHDDLQRCYDLLVPASVSGPAPLVIDMHGWTSNSSTQKSISGFARLAKAESFIVAWPHGVGASFNAGGRCCPPATSRNIDDVGFLRAIVADGQQSTSRR